MDKIRLELPKCLSISKYCPICDSWVTYTPSYGYDAYWNQTSLSRCPKCDAKL